MKTKKEIKKVEKAVWKGWGLKHIHSGKFSRIYGYSPELNLFKRLLEAEATPVEKVVKVEVREV